ncbi:MAG: SRPBCC domain-containing protein [Alphaproteobacteria bacterium]|nr:SRPBCC domain-containing protein [Alphaproteobacteria bacterium]
MRTPALLTLSLMFAGCRHAPRSPDAPRTLTITDTTVVPAPIDVVWQTLTDLEGYAAWNPWIIDGAGDVAPGAVVRVVVVLGEDRLDSRHVVQTLEPPTRFCWRDAGWSAALVYGQRCRTLTPLDEAHTRVTQELLVSGPLAETAMRRYGDAMRDGLAAEQAALALTAPPRPPPPPLPPPSPTGPR